MTHKELAMELAKLEGVEQVFDLMVKDFIEAGRTSSMQKMLATPGATPSEMMKRVQTLESALEKIEYNLRCQYEEFLSSYVSTREALFKPDQIERFIAALRQPLLLSYVTEMRNHKKELSGPISEVFKRMMERAMKTSADVPDGAGRFNL